MPRKHLQENSRRSSLTEFCSKEGFGEQCVKVPVRAASGELSQKGKRRYAENPIKVMIAYDSVSDGGVLHERRLPMASSGKLVGGKRPDDVVDTDDDAPLWSSPLRLDSCCNDNF